MCNFRHMIFGISRLIHGTNRRFGSIVCKCCFNLPIINIRLTTSLKAHLLTHLYPWIFIPILIKRWYKPVASFGVILKSLNSTTLCSQLSEILWGSSVGRVPFHRPWIVTDPTAVSSGTNTKRNMTQRNSDLILFFGGDVSSIKAWRW